MATVTLVRFDNGRAIVEADYSDTTQRVTLIRGRNVTEASIRATIWNPSTGQISGQATLLGGLTLTVAIVNGLLMVDDPDEGLVFPYNTNFEFPAP